MDSEQKPPSSRDNPRVILSIRHYYPDGGGAEVLAHRLVMALKQRGVSVTVLTGRYGRRPRVERIDGVPVRRHFIGLYVPVFHELCYLMSLAWELVARRHEYDVVHAFQTQLGSFMAVILTKRLGKRVITTSHGAGYSGDMAGWSSIPRGGRLLKTVCAGVDAATAVSREVMDELRAAGFDPEKTWYIPNGIPLPPLMKDNRLALRHQLNLPSDRFIVVFVGRLSAEKAPEFLLDTWKLVLEKCPSGYLVFVGDGDRRGTLETKVEETGISNSVLFTGRVHNVKDYLRASDLFVLPSVTEGMPLALLEAMALRLPVVASRVSGTVEVIRDEVNGLLFEAGDGEGLLKRILSLFKSPERRAELGRKARQTIEESFTLDATVDRYLRLYTSVVSGYKPSYKC